MSREEFEKRLEQALNNRFEMATKKLWSLHDEWSREKDEIIRLINNHYESSPTNFEGFCWLKCLVEIYEKRQFSFNASLETIDMNMSATSDYVSPTKSELSDFVPSIHSTPVKNRPGNTVKRKLGSVSSPSAPVPSTSGKQKRSKSSNKFKTLQNAENACDASSHSNTYIITEPKSLPKEIITANPVILQDES